MFLFFILSFTTAFAQNPKFDFGGKLAFDSRIFVQDRLANKIDSYYEILFAPELKVAPIDELSLFAAVEFREDFSDSKRSRIFIDEAYLDILLQIIDFRIGRQEIKWGKTDGIKPTDNFSRRDLRDALVADDYNGIFALKTDVYVGDFTFEGVYAPILERDFLPYYESSRYFTADPTADVSGTTYSLEYNYNETGSFQDSLKYGQYGFMIEYSMRGFDFALNYYDGFNGIPTSIAQSQTAIDNTNSIIYYDLMPTFNRIRSIGTSIATTFSDWIIRGESAYVFTKDMDGNDPLIDDPYLLLVTGIEHTFEDIIFSHDIFFIAQYAMDLETPKKGTVNQDEITSTDLSGMLNHSFEHAGTLNLEYRFSDYYKLICKFFMDFPTKNYLVQPEVSLSPFDALYVIIGGDILGGGSDGLIGALGNHDRIRVKFEYHF